MLRMDGFTLRHARSWAEAAVLWQEANLAAAGEPARGPMYIAGGTDLLPNLKHKIFSPGVLVNLSALRGAVTETETDVVIDASTKLDTLATDPLITRWAAPFAHAASVIAGPQVRTMGSIGGNVLLDTRCLYYNQSEFWRRSLGYCLKAEGTWCHVIGGPKTCVATQSSDTVPVLLAMNAQLDLLGRDGARTLAIRDLYKFNGMDHLSLQKGELLTTIRIPKPQPTQGATFRGSYQKLRTRDSIDFPQLALAITGTFDGPAVQNLQIVVGAVNPQPKGIRGLEAFDGQALDAANIDAITDLVFKQTRPQASTHGDTAWRRQMAVVYTRRGLAALAG